MISFSGRNRLPPTAQRFAPGDIVRHKRYDYGGVVVDVDLACEASESWYDANQTQPDRGQPWYHVFVHERSHTTYVAEENLELDPAPQPVQHPLITHYFSGYGEGHYVRNETPWSRGP